MYSLKERCLQILRDTVKRDHVTKLELPVMLQEELAENAEGTSVELDYVYPSHFVHRR